VKLYFIDIHGNLLEHTRLDRDEARGLAPANGCDILVKNSRGHINSGNSKNYFETIEEAVANFETRQLEFIAQSESKLARERKALDNARSLLHRNATVQSLEA
jgi:hypothetical protein